MVSEPVLALAAVWVVVAPAGTAARPSTVARAPRNRSSFRMGGAVPLGRGMTVAIGSTDLALSLDDRCPEVLWRYCGRRRHGRSLRSAGDAPARHCDRGDPRARPARARHREHLPVRAHGVRPAAHRPRPGDRRLRHPPPLPRVDGRRRPARLERHRHRRQDHRAGPARVEGPGRHRPPVRGGLVAGDGCPQRREADRRSPRHRLGRRDGRAHRGARRPAITPTSPTTASTSTSPVGARLRPPRRPVARPTSGPAGASGRSSAPSTSATRPTSPSGSWPSPTSRPGRHPGATAARAGTPSAS